MAPGAAGPPHTVDAEQVWAVLAGTLRLARAGGELRAGAGDTLILPAGAERRVLAQAGARARVASRAAPLVTAAGQTRPLPWAV